MTILVSFASEDAIIMCADSVITNYFLGNNGDFQEYDVGTKMFTFPGIGIVSTWGDRDHNHIGHFLREQNIQQETHSVDDLRALVRDYLENHLQPKENNMDEVGFHIGGYDRKGIAKLHHIFWGLDRPRINDQLVPEYHEHDHSEKVILYNGRNDLAFTVISALITQIKTRSDTRYDISSLKGLIQLCDLVVRFSAEITPEVGPPFNYCVILPDRTIRTFTNQTFSPINLNNNDPLFLSDHDNTPLILFQDVEIMISPIFTTPSGIKLSDELIRDRSLYIGSNAGTILPLG